MSKGVKRKGDEFCECDNYAGKKFPHCNALSLGHVSVSEAVAERHTNHINGFTRNQVPHPVVPQCCDESFHDETLECHWQR